MADARTRVCFPFSGDFVGGSHLSVEALVRHLDRGRFDPVVLLEGDAPRLTALFASAGCEIHHLPPGFALEHGVRATLGKMARLLWLAPTRAAMLRALRIDIVHSNDGRTHAGWSIPARFARIPLIWHHRGAPDSWGLRFAAPVLADAIVSVSAWALGSRARHRSARVIRSPIDVAPSPEALRTTLLREIGGSPPTFIAAFSGVFIPRKRPLLFVEAIAAIRRQRPGLDVRGVLFGEDMEIGVGEVMAHAERHGVADAIHCLGFRRPGSAWIAASDVLIVPAVDEPLGRTLIEAMLVGTPVVAANSGGSVEALDGGRYGILASDGDADALGAGALSILDDPDRAAAICRRAGAYAGENFSARAHAQAIMALYDRLLARRGRARPAAVMLSGSEMPV